MTVRFSTPTIVGVSTTDWLDEHDALLDELVFDVTFDALAEAGLRKQDVDITVIASMDLYDARAISSAITTPAAAGYLVDSYRLEGDVAQAIVAASAAIEAGDADVAVAVGVHNPEIRADGPVERRAVMDGLSALAFEPHADRPVGMSADTALALHAAAALGRGETDVEAMAALAAAEISRGRDDAVSAEDVLASPVVATPLHALMLPALSTGAVAVVLASEARARRCWQQRARIVGHGQATGGYTWDGGWLEHPEAASARAARAAYTRASIKSPGDELALAEITSLTPALHAPLCAALGLRGFGDDRINPTGGARSCFPGLANGGLRVASAIEALERSAHHGAGRRRAVVHAVDAVTGPIADTATVLVLEEV